MSKKILHPLVYKDSSLELYLEKTEDDLLFIHAYANKWSREIYDEFLGVWIELLEELKKRGYNEIYAAVKDNKLRKFAAMFGFVESSITIVDSAGDYRQVMICSM